MKPFQAEPPVLPLRVGINLPSWTGMVTKEAQRNLPRDPTASVPAVPAAIPDHALTHLENVRFIGGRVVSRPGQSKVNEDPVEGCIEGLFDAGDIGAPNVLDDTGDDLYHFFYAYGGGKWYVHVHPDLSIDTHEGIDANHYETVVVEVGDTALVIGWQEGETHGGVESSDDTVLGMPAFPDAIGTYSFPRDLIAISDTEYLVSWEDNAPGAKQNVARGGTDDGVSELDADHLGVLGLLGSTAFCGARLGIYRRDSPGSWTFLPYPDVNCFESDMLEFGGRLYIIGLTFGGLAILSTDGTSVTLDHVIGDFDAPNGVSKLGVCDGNLYYWYDDGDGGSGYSLIGKFDGVDFTDDEKDLTGSGTFTQSAGMVASDLGLDVMFYDEAGHLHVLQSPGTDIAGTWSEVADLDVPTSRFGISISEATR